MKNIKEGTKKVYALLGVEIFEINENYIADLRERRKDKENIFKILPEFTLNTNNSANYKLILAEFFHQFTGWEKEDNPNEFTFFNLKTTSNYLQEEIDEIGIEELFKSYNFLRVLSVFPKHDTEDLKHFIIPETHYLIIELTYHVSYDHYSGGYEGDLDISIIGYLDENFNKKYYEHETIHKRNIS